MCRRGQTTCSKTRHRSHKLAISTISTTSNHIPNKNCKYLFFAHSLYWTIFKRTTPVNRYIILYFLHELCFLNAVHFWVDVHFFSKTCFHFVHVLFPSQTVEVFKTVEVFTRTYANRFMSGFMCNWQKKHICCNCSICIC